MASPCRRNKIRNPKYRKPKQTHRQINLKSRKSKTPNPKEARRYTRTRIKYIGTTSRRRPRNVAGANDEFLEGSPGHGLILAELVCPLRKTSVSGTPRAPDGGFTPTMAANVGATSTV